MFCKAVEKQKNGFGPGEKIGGFGERAYSIEVPERYQLYFNMLTANALCVSIKIASLSQFFVSASVSRFMPPTNQGGVIQQLFNA